MLRATTSLMKATGTTKIVLMAYGGVGIYQSIVKRVCDYIKLEYFSVYHFFFISDVAAWKMKWLNQEPKNTLGVIVYLTSVRELPQLNISLLSLRQNLFKPRPIVIFHEGDFNNVNVQLALATTLGTNIPISFEHIRFPTKVNTFCCV
ncbi:unnamed protein product [Rotaria magnacalcarata]|uniref:Uncharacterized protein n=1 Tax=Rotaria magnacalcarata TaxID=392030 RepID=A0A8S3J2R2_9BILA|nr:unnamed protein product [Rotaria magnacalcarata]